MLIRATGILGLVGAYYFTQKHPITGSRRFLLWGQSIDIMIGKFTSDQLRFQYKSAILPDTSHVHQMVHHLTQQLIPQFPISRNWNVSVIKADQVNAFVTPDGSIFIFTGLLKAVNSLDELAWVLAHEISHVYLRHSANQLALKGIIFISIALLQLYFIGDVYNVSYLEELFFYLPKSRKHELEADLCGVQIISQLGLKAQAAKQILHTLGEMNGENPVSLLSTHPTSQEREIALVKEIEKAEEKVTEKEVLEKRKQLVKVENEFRMIKRFLLR